MYTFCTIYYVLYIQMSKTLCFTLTFTPSDAACSFQDIIKKFDINLSDMVGSFSETVQGIYPFLFFFFFVLLCITLKSFGLFPVTLVVNVLSSVHDTLFS